jgi:hypothetical protein
MILTPRKGQISIDGAGKVLTIFSLSAFGGTKTRSALWV